MMPMTTTCLTGTQHIHHAPAQPSTTDENETEVIVEQYSPTWVMLMLAGASVRSGNIIETAGIES